MAWSGGVFSRVRNWAQDKLNSINPQAALFDQEDDNFATGLSNCVTKDGLNKPSATMDFNTQRLTALGDATGATDALNRQTADARYQLTLIQVAVKTATTARSSTGVSDDPHLLISLAAGSYSIDLFMSVLGQTAGTAGFKFGWAFTGTSTAADFAVVGFLNGATYTNPSVQLAATGFITAVGTNSVSKNWIRFSGFLVVTVTGNLKFQWATQNGGENTSAMLGSWMTATKLA